MHRICKRGEYVDLGKINILTERCMDPKLSEEKLVTLRLPYPGREDRLVRVYVPACKEGETLPVIYMSDGQNLFDKGTKHIIARHTIKVATGIRFKSVAYAVGAIGTPITRRPILGIQCRIIGNSEPFFCKNPGQCTLG